MTLLPKASQTFVDPRGYCTPAFYRFLQALQGTDYQAQITAIATALGSPDGTVENIPPITAGEFVETTARVLGVGSILSEGTLEGGVVQLSLAGDNPEPAATSYYGTDSAGERGFHPVSGALAQGDNITLETAADGVTTIAVAKQSLTASGAISALRAIVAENGTGRYPNVGVSADAGKVVGISVTAAADTQPFDVLTGGEWTDAGWAWSPGPVFCGASGVLTQTPPAGWVLEVGRALSATRLRVAVKTPFLRA